MRFLLGVAIASVALFFWGFVFWGISPYPASIIKEMPGQDIVAKAVAAGIQEDGVYMIPGMGDPNDEAWAKRNQAGPHITMMYHSGEASPMQMIYGYLHSSCPF